MRHEFLDDVFRDGDQWRQQRAGGSGHDDGEQGAVKNDLRIERQMGFDEGGQHQLGVVGQQGRGHQ